MFKEDCVFCMRALQKEYDWVKHFHDEVSIVSFEPLNPVTPGHRLFLPAWHIEHSSMADRVVSRTFQSAYEFATGGPESFNLIISVGGPATQTVPHIHVHYVPRRPNDNLTLPWTGQNKENQ